MLIEYITRAELVQLYHIPEVNAQFLWLIIIILSVMLSLSLFMYIRMFLYKKYLPVKNDMPDIINITDYIVMSNHAEKIYDENDEALKKLRKYFVKNNQNTYTNIMQEVKSGNLKTAYRMAHALKSNAGQIGEKHLQDAASVIEKMLENDENNITPKSAEVLKNELNNVLTKLAPLLVNDEANACNELINKDEIREVLKQLEPLLISKNVKSLKLLDDVYRIPGAADLAVAIENFDYKKALVKLENIKQNCLLYQEA